MKQLTLYALCVDGHILLNSENSPVLSTNPDIPARAGAAVTVQNGKQKEVRKVTVQWEEGQEGLVKQLSQSHLPSRG